VVAAGLSLVAIGVARSVRWVVAVTLVVCAGQIGAAIGIVLELVYGVAPFKAAQLRRLGFDPPGPRATPTRSRHTSTTVADLGT
jgi:hypothetical protein